MHNYCTNALPAFPEGFRANRNWLRQQRIKKQKKTGDYLTGKIIKCNGREENLGRAGTLSLPNFCKPTSAINMTC
jgi:hypothetical protein